MSSFDSLLQLWVFHTALLGIKMLAMVLMTGFYRFKNQTVISPEDAISIFGFDFKTKTDDEQVERVRRAHTNDSENLPAYFAISYCYILTEPSFETAVVLFWIVTVARYLHTIVYTIIVIRQPARFLAFGSAYLIMVYMTIASAIHFSQAAFSKSETLLGHL